MELGAGFDETWGKIRWDLVQDLMELGAKFNGCRAQYIRMCRPMLRMCDPMLMYVWAYTLLMLLLNTPLCF